MIAKTLTAALTLGSIAAAAPSIMSRQTATQKLLIGTPDQILTADFDGDGFQVTSKNESAGSVASWMRYNADTNTLYAVNENADNLNLFTLDSETKTEPTFFGSATGSSGVVFLEFNKDKTRMVGAGYGSAKVDVWDISDSSALPTLLKSLTVEGELGPGQEAHHPHQALIDPTGDFIVIPDLGGDQLLVLDTRDDKYEFTNAVPLFSGAGPRHGGFITSGDKTFYMVACEVSNQLILFGLDYSDESGLGFTELQKQSTYGEGVTPPTGSAAGTLIIASNNRDVYISNRLTGDESDSIAHFVFSSDDSKLTFADSVPCLGIQPRDMSFSADEALIFIANQAGANGLVALQRSSDSGALTAEPIAVHAMDGDIVAPGQEGATYPGPQFVKLI
ncbi:putative isomerase YbhE [Poronia punctata]|nr:putative isomerase YbhE [Poronia punctata]